MADRTITILEIAAIVLIVSGIGVAGGALVSGWLGIGVGLLATGTATVIALEIINRRGREK